MKVLIVVGARPNFVKVAPLFKAIREFNAVHECWGPGIRPVLVHTGQHYDEPMSGGFFAHLDLPVPEVSLSVGSGTHAEQTAEIMRRFEPVLVAEQAEALVVVGDVNSTLACALVAAKLPRPARPLIAHVEAGLRSFDRSMPEEINRTLTDSVSDLLFVTEESAIDNLRREGIDPGRVHFVGNTMIDSLLAWEPRADRSSALTRYKLQPGGYALLTLHRGANVDERENFIEILEGLQELAELCPILFPLHPRTQRRIAQLALECYFTDSKLPNHEQSSTRAYGGDIRTTGPLSYLDFIHLMKNARLVVTDSGGVQEETTALGIPCVTVRDNTERPVTTTLGTNVLAGTRRAAIRESIRGQLACPRRGRIPAGWDGRAASRIVEILLERIRGDSTLVMGSETRQIQENAR